jgi:ABC-type glycerol-3-phosphate transport system permease component
MGVLIVTAAVPIKKKHRRPLSKAGSAVARVALLLLFLLPIYLAIVSAFRPNGDIFKYGGTLSWQTFLPVPATLANFQDALALPNFPIQMLNTAVLAVVQASGTVILALLAAFALARIRFRFKNVIFYLILATMFLPFEALAAPLFLITKDLGQLNSFWGLLLPWVAAPIAIFILRQAISDIPTSFDEAVMIDGGGLFRIFQVVIVPNVWPAMLTAWLTTFIYSWDSFLWPLIIIQDPTKQLAQIGIVNLINPNEVAYGTLFAASLLVTVPVVLLFLFLQRYYQEGTAATGLK